MSNNNQNIQEIEQKNALSNSSLYYSYYNLYHSLNTHISYYNNLKKILLENRYIFTNVNVDIQSNKTHLQNYLNTYSKKYQSDYLSDILTTYINTDIPITERDSIKEYLTLKKTFSNTQNKVILSLKDNLNLSFVIDNINYSIKQIDLILKHINKIAKYQHKRYIDILSLINRYGVNNLYKNMNSLSYHYQTLNKIYENNTQSLKFYNKTDMLILTTQKNKV